MSVEGVLVSGRITLTRAQRGDIDALAALQRSAYAINRRLLGVEPLPLLADYDEIFNTHEIWLAKDDGAITGAIVLEPRADDLLLWSIATSPRAQGQGLGTALLGATEARARQFGVSVVRL